LSLTLRGAMVWYCKNSEYSTDVMVEKYFTHELNLQLFIVILHFIYLFSALGFEFRAFCFLGNLSTA
jgi:hypothetical protein